MNVGFDDFGIYHIDIWYLKYLYEIDSEVFYSESKAYQRKPFLGVVIGIGEFQYFIPLTSGKQKHLRWNNSGPAHFLIYENVSRGGVGKKDICKNLGNGMFKKLLSVLDIKKMIPVPDGVYQKVDFSKETDYAYRVLMEKEYRFCQRIQDGILKRAKRIYEIQREQGEPLPFYCNFSVLEDACLKYQSCGEASVP